MGGKRIMLLAAVIVVPGAAGYWLMRDHSAPPPHATEPAAVAPVDQPAKRDVTLDTLAADLSSGDSAIKAAAADYLRALHYRHREELAQLRNRTVDPATRALLTARLREIYTQLATEPPPISLHVDNATLAEVIDALNAEMGTHLPRPRTDIGNTGNFSVDADDKPFWEVISILAGQGAFTITPWSQLHFNMSVSGNGIRYHAISGPLCFYVESQSIGIVTRPPTFLLRGTVLADPRMEVAEINYGLYGQNTLNYGPDSKGNVLNRFSGGSGQLTAKRAATGSSVGIQPYLIEDHGDALSSVSARVTVKVLVPDEVALIPDLGGQSQWDVQMGDMRVALSDESGGDWTSVACRVTPPERAGDLELAMQDVQGGMLWSLLPTAASQETVFRQTVNSFHPGKPFQMRITAGKQTRDITATFEVKDVPVPPQ